MYKTLTSLLDVISYMRGHKELEGSLKGGCPWHMKLTLGHLKKYIQGESKELVEAIENIERDENTGIVSPEKVENFKEELGDLLLQILVATEIAQEKELFNLDDVFQRLEHKLRFRSPHLFEAVPFSSLQEIEKMWQERKVLEKKAITLLK